MWERYPIYTYYIEFNLGFVNSMQYVYIGYRYHIRYYILFCLLCIPVQKWPKLIEKSLFQINMAKYLVMTIPLSNMCKLDSYCSHSEVYLY